MRPAGPPVAFVLRDSVLAAPPRHRSISLLPEVKIKVTMMKQILAFVALFATASAFAPVSQAAFGVAKSSALSMASKAPEATNGFAAAVAGVMPAIIASSAALATEGTGEPFGIDDNRLIGVLFLGHWLILSLWAQQYKNQDESEDFFGEIDYTMRK